MRGGGRAREAGGASSVPAPPTQAKSNAPRQGRYSAAAPARSCREEAGVAAAALGEREDGGLGRVSLGDERIGAGLTMRKQ